MISPLSGRYGFLIFGPVEIPIYSWMISSVQNRTTYRTSTTSNFPNRLKGTISEQIIIRGANYGSPFITNIVAFNDTSVSFYVGWNDFLASVRKAILCQAMLVDYRVDLNYFSSPMPSYVWTATLVGSINTKELINYPLVPQHDAPFCANQLCNKTITTTDAQLHGGLVWHVKRASIIDTISRSPYMTSSSNNHLASTYGVKDEIVELDVQGDFDYWFNNLSTSDTTRDYKFFYGPGVADFRPVDKMKIVDINNFVVNIQTGELIQMTVHLGAAYG